MRKVWLRNLWLGLVLLLLSGCGYMGRFTPLFGETLPFGIIQALPWDATARFLRNSIECDRAEYWRVRPNGTKMLRQLEYWFYVNGYVLALPYRIDAEPYARVLFLKSPYYGLYRVSAIYRKDDSKGFVLAFCRD